MRLDLDHEPGRGLLHSLTTPSPGDDETIRDAKVAARREIEAGVPVREMKKPSLHLLVAMAEMVRTTDAGSTEPGQELIGQLAHALTVEYERRLTRRERVQMVLRGARRG